jgi:hypothetical protein
LAWLVHSDASAAVAGAGTAPTAGNGGAAVIVAHLCSAEVSPVNLRPLVMQFKRLGTEGYST